ncbi:MAG: glycosyltransferase [Bacillota bacterium]
MKTSIIILTYNKLEYTQKCIESIRKYTKFGTYEIIVVDNNSTDGTVDWLRRQKDLRVIYNKENMGFPKGCNQGIEISMGSNILLLNNDTIVTHGWLNNLLNCLYSSEAIGAVGPVTNNCSNQQTIEVSYQTEQEMHNFARKYNQPDCGKWEQRLKLVGYCLLIRREVIDKVGLLDERFSPGNFEDDDLSFRIIQAGYTLLLCKDTFIHHFGSVSFKEQPSLYKELLERNKKIFIEKWGIDPTYSLNIRNDIIGLMDLAKDNIINVLEVGCACGGTLLKIKSINENSQLFGIELNEHAAKIAGNFAEVTAENIESGYLNYPEGFFDYIIFADVLEHLYDPLLVLTQIKKYLKPQGVILASIPNVMHYSVIKNLLLGYWTYEDAGILDKTHVRFFTFNEIDKLFKNAGFSNIEYRSIVLGKNNKDDEFIKSLASLTGSNLQKQYETYQYLIKATDLNDFSARNIYDATSKELSKDVARKIIFLLRRIENEISINENLSSLFQLLANNEVSVKEIIDLIQISIVKKEDIINLLAVQYFQSQLENVSLELLEHAYMINPQNSATCYNLAYIINQLGDSKTALMFLTQLKEKDDNILEFIAEIEGKQYE